MTKNSDFVNAQAQQLSHILHDVSDTVREATIIEPEAKPETPPVTIYDDRAGHERGIRHLKRHYKAKKLKAAKTGNGSAKKTSSKVSKKASGKVPLKAISTPTAPSLHPSYGSLKSFMRAFSQSEIQPAIDRGNKELDLMQSFAKRWLMNK
jgi:hypothetical protein